MSGSKYIVSARKYRPAKWDEVVGQEAITETLQNAINSDHLAQAYLFCGPRGVGKTTCARIFAREINLDEGEAISDHDFSFNVFELDAASNNKVEDIRSLTDQVRIPPQVGNYKVYIIDEVHMLSTAAFNAFLKTLEEPPSHAIFILATTEKHKIIPTILSRCQIYDFNRISVPDIAAHLEEIAKKEKVSAENEALHLVAQKADGALRDALSIFDQLISFTKGNLTYANVLENLHILDYDYYFKITRALQDAQYADALLIFDEIISNGFDAHHFVTGFASHLRDLLVCKDARTVGLLEVSESIQKQYFDQAKELDSDWIFNALEACNQADINYRNSGNSRLLVELTLLRICQHSAEKKKPDSEPLASQTFLEEPQPTTIRKKEEAASAPLPSAISSTEVIPTEVINPSTPKESAQMEEPTVNPNPEAIALQNKRKKPTRRSTISITEEQAPISETATEQISPSKIREEGKTDLDSISSAWQRMLERQKTAGNNSLHSILARQNIAEQYDDKVITINLQHEVEVSELDLHKGDLLSQLRDDLQNDTIGLVSVVKEMAHDKKLFTAQDKFDYLAQKNPKLKDLRATFDLDISI